MSHKRSYQSSGSVDLSNKKIRPTAEGNVSPAASTALNPAAKTVAPSIAAARSSTTPSSLARPLSTAPSSNRAANTASGITVTNIPKPGSSLSNQANVGPLNLIPAVSGTQLAASVRDEYLSLLHKTELIDLIKQLERQLNDLIAAPTGSSTLYRQARIYPNQIHAQIDRLKARQRVEASRTTTHSDLSLKDVYSLLNSNASPSNAPSYTRTPSAAPRSTPSAAVTGRPAASMSSSASRRPAPPSSAATASSAGQKQAPKDSAQNASLTSLINSINAMVRQQAQPARGPNGMPLPPAQTLSTNAAARTTPLPTANARQASGSTPSITPAALRSIVGDGPMPSNAALAAAIAAHFGGNLPANAPVPPRSASSASPSSSSPATSSATRVGAAASKSTTAASNTPCVAPLAPGPGKDISDKIAAILGSSSTSQTTMLGPQGLPLAPAAASPGTLPIGNIAAMLSSFAGQASPPNANPGRTNPSNRIGTPAVEGQDNALSNLLQQLEEAKKRLPSQPTASPVSANSTAMQDPIAILTGASANPVFTPTYPAMPSMSTSTDIAGHRDASWSPEPEPVIVQGPLGTSTLPSYEDMIVEGLRVMGQAPPRTLFNWMQVTYPLTKKFRPSAHQALQKAFKRGRLLKTGSNYRINPSWSDPGESRKPTRRPQVGRDHPMVTPGLNGEVLAVSPLKDSQAYRNVGDSGLRAAKGVRSGPRPYGQPGAAPLPNPASSIFQNGSAASVILEYQKRTGKKLDADSVKQLYQLIRAGPSDGSAEEILAHLLTQTGYHDEAATATAAAAAQTAAAAMSASMPSYARPTAATPSMASGSSARAGVSTSGAATQRRMPTTPVAKGPTSLPLPTTSEPTMMQQLASMLNDLSSPINPVLANSLLGQLSSNAAAAAAARAASMPGMGAVPPSLPAAPTRTLAPAPSGPSSATSQLASALSSLAGQAPQQDLDSAVSETLAAALQQIGGASTTASEDVTMEAVTEEPPAAKTTQASDEGPKEVAATGESGDAEEGIDLAEYEDAIRALTSALGSSGDDAEGDDSEESDVEADERAIAAAEAEPDSVEEAAPQPGDGNKPNEADEEAQASTAAPDDAAKHGEREEEDDEDAEEEEQMDLSAVLQQLTASLQAHEKGEAATKGETSNKDQNGSSAAAASESKDTDASKEAESGIGERNEDGQAEASQGSSDEASLQAQLEALVASLAANAENAEDEDDDEDDDHDEGEEGGHDAVTNDGEAH